MIYVKQGATCTFLVLYFERDGGAVKVMRGSRVSETGTCFESFPLTYDEFETLFLEAQERNATLDLTDENMPNIRKVLAGEASFSEAFVKPRPLAQKMPGLSP